MKPNCFDCKYQKKIPGDAHIECAHPSIGMIDRMLSPLALMAGIRTDAMRRLNVTGDVTGIRRSWFAWPLNFDPVWLQTCDGFEKKETTTMKRTTTSELSLAVSPTNATNATN